MDRENQQMRLRDGRMLGYAEYGAPGGKALLYFHGWPGSRFEAGAMQEVCRQLQVRLIAPDRPGLGLSDFFPRRSIVDFCPAVRQLADGLGLGRFAVLGVSGGGPYAAACAATLPEQVSAALLVCSVGPIDAPHATEGMVWVNRWLLGIARRFPRLGECIGSACLRAIWRKGEQPLPKQIEARLPAADRQALFSKELRRALTASSVEALRHGPKAVAADGMLYARPWGFALGEIRAPVFLWHGEADVIVPPPMGHYLARHIPGCRAQFYADDGHFSLPFARCGEILASALGV